MPCDFSSPDGLVHLTFRTSLSVAPAFGQSSGYRSALLSFQTAFLQALTSSGGSRQRDHFSSTARCAYGPRLLPAQSRLPFAVLSRGQPDFSQIRRRGGLRAPVHPGVPPHLQRRQNSSHLSPHHPVAS